MIDQVGEACLGGIGGARRPSAAAVTGSSAGACGGSGAYGASAVVLYPSSENEGLIILFIGEWTSHEPCGFGEAHRGEQR